MPNKETKGFPYIHFVLSQVCTMDNEASPSWLYQEFIFLSRFENTISFLYFLESQRYSLLNKHFVINLICGLLEE